MKMARLGRIAIVPGLAVKTLIVTPRDALLCVRMAVWVVLISVVARLTSLPRAHQIASFTTGSITASRFTPAQLARAIDRVLGVDLLVFRRSCWKRAMVLHRFLALAGIESRINFGLQKERDGTLSGHAWLERDGLPFLEDAHGAYVVTFSLPRTSSAPGILPRA